MTHGAVAFSPKIAPRVNPKMVATTPASEDAKAEFCWGLPGNIAPAGNFDPAFNGINGPAINMIPQLPVPLWFAMTLGIGIAESTRVQKGFANPYDGEIKGTPSTAFPKEDTTFQRLREGYVPGDLGFDPLGLKPTDPAEFRTMQEKELSHGRLAMLAAAGFMAQEAATGQTWGAQDNMFENLIFGGWFATKGALAM